MIENEYRSSAALGILYAEDFDAEPEQPAPAPEPAAKLRPVPEPQPEPMPEAKAAQAIPRADVNALCIRAVEAAQAAWAESAQERRTLALEALAEGLASARRDSEEAAEAVADGVARTALAMVASLLPELCKSHGDQEVRTLVKTLLPLVARTGPVVVRVRPELIELVRADIDTLNDGAFETVELRAANLSAGDVKLIWDEGSLARDSAAIRKAIENSLAQLGLTGAPETISSLQDAWSFAYAE